MSEIRFELVYDGPALRDGEMPVRDLAPALLALGDLFASTSRALYPDREPIAVNVQATREGSFALSLVLESKKAWDAFVDISGSHGASALANLYQLVGGTFGLFAFLRIRSRIKRTDQAAVPGHIVVTLVDGTVIDFPTEVLELARRTDLQRRARDVVAPLKREGINEAKFIDDRQQTGVIVTKDDVPEYEVPEDEDTLLDIEQEAYVEILSPYFEDGKKWRVRLTEGVTISATVDDPDFLARIDQGEPFRKGDFLRCRMRVVQTRRANGLHSDYTIIEVLAHYGKSDGDQLLLGEPTE